MGLTASGYDVIGARMVFPRLGCWFMDLALDTTDTVATGQALTVTSDVDGSSWSGVVERVRPYLDTNRLRLVGAGGMAGQAAPKFYAQVPAKNIATDIVAAASATLSTASASLATPLAFWSIPATTCGSAMATLAAAIGLNWRALADGTVWVGAESWATYDPDRAQMVDLPAENRSEYACPTPNIFPGTTVDGLKVSMVEHLVEVDRVRSLVWWEA